MQSIRVISACFNQHNIFGKKKGTIPISKVNDWQEKRESQL